jgi:hypothetical protein
VVGTLVFLHCKSCRKVAVVTIREFNVVVDGRMSGMVGRFMEGGGGKYQDVWFEPGEVVAIASVTRRDGVVAERERDRERETERERFCHSLGLCHVY